MQAIKNRLIKFSFKLFFLFSKKKSPPSLLQNIAIFTTTGLGDSLWAIPAIDTLKTSFPQAKLTVLVSPIGKEALLHHPKIDRMIVYSLFSFFQLYRILKKEKFDAILIFHASQRKIFILAQLLNPFYLIGTVGRSKDLDFIYTHPIKVHKEEHEIERRLQLTYALGASPIEDQRLKIYLQPEERKEAEKFLASKNISQEDLLIGIHPGSKDLFKRWPKEYYQEVLEKLSSKGSYKFVITGSMTESTLVQNLSKQIPNSIPLFGQISLRQIMAIIERMSLYITNDTGPMHIAFALNVKTIALFSPTHPESCGPHQAKNVTIEYVKRCCTPCLHKKCHDPFCMRQISKNDVYQHACHLLQLKKLEN
jgi:heptosyltransferase-2